MSYQSIPKWYKKEDSWSILIGLGFIILFSLFYLIGFKSVLSLFSFSIPSWSSLDQLVTKLSEKVFQFFNLYLLLAGLLTLGAKSLGYQPVRFLKGFTLLYFMANLILIISANKVLKSWQLDSPLVALFVGLVLSNLVRFPEWFKEALRTEYYVKTGIILMGATLPFILILQAGPAAIGQALIVSVVTFFSIYLSGVKLFGLDRRFAACLGAGGSVCGVSAAIAIGGACRAKPEHVSVSISMVIIWAVAMIFILPYAAKALALDPGVAGAWIGTSEFADAAGFAAAAAIGDEAATQAFTLMKIVGRDMFVGVWAFLVAILAVTVWERKSASNSERIDAAEIWHRFPKFIIGFFIASLFTTVISASLTPEATNEYSKAVLGLMKNLRGWFFTLTFLSIGLTTRFKDLTAVGFKPLLAFTIGVAINLPLGYYLSNHVFDFYWKSL